MTTDARKRYRLRNMKVTRVDLVDKGANEDAHILLAKALHDPKADKKRDAKKAKVDPRKKTDVDIGSSGKAEIKGDAATRIRELLAGADKEKAPAKSAGAADGGTPFQPTPISPREPGSQSRIVSIDPAMFEVVSATGNMMEWEIGPDDLPEGIEQAMMTMVQSGETVVFQWLIDPLVGPPVEGNAKTAAEAFVAMRGALTNQAGMDPLAPLGGLDGQAPVPGQPGVQPGAQPGVPPGAAGKAAAPQPAGQLQKPKPKPKVGRQAQVRKALHGGGIAGALRNLSDKKKKKKRKKDDDEPAIEVTKFNTTGNNATVTFSGATSTPHTYTVSNTPVKTAEQRVTSALELITKGLVEVDVLTESATSEDVRDILPDNLLAELHNELSA